MKKLSKEEYELNCYEILNVESSSSIKEIRSAYRQLSVIHHPDKGGDPNHFHLINKSYKILTECREDYDKLSKFGADYTEESEMFKVDFGDYDHEDFTGKYNKFKRDGVNDIHVEVDDTFTGKLNIQRWICCKKCGGNGKDMDSRIQIKDSNGVVIREIEGADECDFCDGVGKDMYGNKCTYCSGLGKVGMGECQPCSGEGRVFGNQTIKNIKLTGEVTIKKLLGNYDKMGRMGDLFIHKIKK